jgi:ABC-type amino acid transport substrate-binding protein
VLQNVWQTTANDLQLPFKTLTTPSKEQAFAWLNSGKGNMIIGPLKYTDRQGNDYLNSYVGLDLGVLAPFDDKSNLWGKTLLIISIIFSKVVWVLFIILGFFAVLIWWADRQGANSPFQGNPATGLMRAFWFQVTTFTTVAYGDTIPTTNLGRAMTLTMQFIYLFLLSTFTASITAQITTLQVEGQPIVSLAQLHDKKVAYLETEPFVLTTINKYFAFPVKCHSLAELVELVNQKKVSVAIANRLTLRGYLNINQQIPLFLTRFVINQGDYVFILKPHNSLGMPLAMELYQLNIAGVQENIIAQYFGADNGDKLQI